MNKFKKTMLATTVLAMSLTLVAKEAPTPGYNTKIPEKIMTPDKVQTRIGELNFYDGVPTMDTVKKVYDNLDFMRGVEVFMNFIPATSIEGLHLGLQSLGADDYNKVVIMDKLMDSTPLFLTGSMPPHFLT